MNRGHPDIHQVVAKAGPRGLVSHPVSQAALSDAGLKVSDLATLADQAWIAFD